MTRTLTLTFNDEVDDHLDNDIEVDKYLDDLDVGIDVDTTDRPNKNNSRNLFVEFAEPADVRRASERGGTEVEGLLETFGEHQQVGRNAVYLLLFQEMRYLAAFSCPQFFTILQC